MKNKTAIEWLNEARANGETWVDEAIANINLQPDYEDRKNDYQFLSSVIFCEFSWADTPQLEDYWGDVHDRLFDSGNQSEDEPNI